LAAAYLQQIDRLEAGSKLGEFDRAELAALANRSADTIGPEPTECGLLALTAAEDLLGELAPTGFYFGANEGDGAAIGFWITEEWAECLERMGMGNDCPSGWAALIGDLEADGIDLDCFEDAYQGQANGWSEERAGADYAQQLAEDCDSIPSDLRWPLTCIDWEDAWRELQMGDGYRLHDIGGGDWLVFRSI
jgi:hypothetical protein